MTWSAQPTTDELRRILLWAGREGPGIGRVVCSATATREDGVSEIGKQLVRPVATVVLSIQPSARATAAALEAAVESCGAVVVHVIGWEQLDGLSPVKAGEILAAIVMRRERLAILPSRQIWWLTPRIVSALSVRAVDLDDWFTLRVDLPDLPPKISTPAPAARARTRPVAEARSLASDLEKRFREALSRKLAPGELWAELAEPAVEALIDAGLELEAKGLRSRLLESVAGLELPEPGADAADVFISHAGADLAWAEWVGWTLEEAGIRVRLDRWDWKPGADFILEMDRALRECRSVLVVLTPAFLRAGWTSVEWSAALRKDPQGRGGHLIPVRVSPVEPEGLLGGRIWIDLVGLPEEDARELLVQRVQVALGDGKGRPTEAPKFPGAKGPAPTSTPPPFPGALPPIWNIPRPPVGFTGRQEELAELDRLVAQDKGPIALTQAMVGLGGIGKSSLARKWAHEHAGEFSLGWSLRAENLSTWEEDLLGLGRELGLLDPRAPIEDRRAAIQRVDLWLRAPSGAAAGKRWLLVADNAGDPAALDLPQGKGVILVTSRDRRWKNAAKELNVPVLSPAASRELLRRGLVGAGNRDQDADAVANALGYLPLAMAQAHGWCVETGQTLVVVIRRLDGHAPAVLRFPPGSGEAAVATTWGLLVSGLTPAAKAVLEVLSLLAPEDIPIDALFAGDPGQNTDGIGEDLLPLIGGVDALDEAVGALHRHCLVDRNGDRVDVHRLVQRVVREGLTEGQRSKKLEEARRLLWRSMPSPKALEGWPLWSRLIAHVEATTDEAAPEDALVAQLLGQSAVYLFAQARFRGALRWQERAIVITERALGPDHPDTARCLGNLAETLSALGQRQEARPLQERALVITERALGPDHPDTATCLDNLAATLSALGQDKEARPLQERALVITERALGPDHPDTAIRLGNLAETLSALGQPKEARPFQERALVITERALGPDHPSTARCLGNLAATLYALGQHEGARPLEERALVITERALGPDHPDTARCLGNLAGTLRTLGQPKGARRLQERALVITERALGPDHPDTARCLGNLAVTLWTSGEREAARGQMSRAVTIFRTRLGADHPTTLHFVGQWERMAGSSEGGRLMVHAKAQRRKGSRGKQKTKRRRR